MPFGLPAEMPNPGPIVQELGDNNQQLGVVVSAITDSLGSDLSEYEALNGLVMTALRKSLAGKVGANRKQIQQLLEPLGGEIVSATATNQSLLDSMMSLLGGALDEANPEAAASTPVSATPDNLGILSSAPVGQSVPLSQNPWDVQVQQIEVGDSSVKVVSAELDLSEDDAGPPIRPLFSPHTPMPATSAACLAAGASGALAGGLPYPGSPEFCQALPQIVTWLSGVGDTIIAWVTQVSDIDTLVARLTKEADNYPTNGVSDRLMKSLLQLLSWVAKSGKPVWQWLSDAIKVLWQWYQCLTARYSPSALAGLTLLESALECVKKFRLGTDFTAWITGDFGMRVSALEEVLRLLRHYFCPLTVPSVSDATGAWLKGYIDIPLRDCVWLLNGINPEVYSVYAESQGTRLSATDGLRALRRAGASPADEEALLRSRGYLSAFDAAGERLLFDRIPNLTQAIQFQRRGIADGAGTARYGLLDADYDKLWRANAPGLRSQGVTEDMARQEYAASWTPIHPSEAREFLYRLRPGKPDVLNPFEASDYDYATRVAGYAPTHQAWAHACAYRLPPTSEVLAEFALDRRDALSVTSHYQDLGYSADDAARLTSLAAVDKARRLAAATHGLTPDALARLYSVRLLSPEQVRLYMRDLYYTNEQAETLMARADGEYQQSIIRRARSRLLTTVVREVKAALQVGVIDEAGATRALGAAGWPADVAAGIASLETASAGVQAVKDAVGATRKAYLAGEVDFVYAAAALARAGVTPGAQQRYLQTWQSMLTPGRKRRSASQISTDVSLGRLTTSDALARLVNLGYTDADTRLYLADAQAKAQKLAQQQFAAEQKAGKAQQKALDEAVKAAAKQHREVVDALKASSPLASMKKWAKLHLIDQNTFIERLKVYGYSDTDAEREWDAATGVQGSPPSDSPP